MTMEVRKGPPPRPAPTVILRAATGGVLAVGLLLAIMGLTDTALLMAPFGASCVLLFCAPDSPLAQPRAVIGGHVLSTAVGLAVMALAGTGPLAMALGVGLAIALMMATRTTHAPAGADPLLVMMTGQGWLFLVTPVLAGTVLLVLAAWTWHRVTRPGAYPVYWW